MLPTAASKHRNIKESIHNKPQSEIDRTLGQPHAKRRVTRQISQEKYTQLSNTKSTSRINKMYNTVGNTPHAPDYSSQDQITGGYSTQRDHFRSSIPSQISKNDQQLLMPKGSNLFSKKPTKILMGAPTNMEKRVISRTSQSRDRSLKDKFNDVSAFNLTDGSNLVINSSQNFVSMKSISDKAYQQRKLGINGLKPYQSSKTIVYPEEAKPNQVNIALQQMNIKRELAILKGNINRKINKDFLDDGRETSEEDDYQQIKSDEDGRDGIEQVTKLQMQQLLFQINYLPFMKNQDKYNIDSKVILEGQKQGTGSNFKDEVQQAYNFLDQFWYFLNPQNNQKIRRYDFYKIMKILMLSIGKYSETDIHTKIANFMVSHYNKQGIDLKIPKYLQEKTSKQQQFSFQNQELDPETMKVIEE